MLYERSDAEAIYDLRHRGRDRDILIEIAAILRREVPQPDETFLHFLADQIDPRIKNTFTNTKLILRETKARQKHPKDDVGHFLELHIDIFNEPAVEAVVSCAMDRFQCSRATCYQKLSKARARQVKNPEMFEDIKRVCHSLRERGVSDYAPLDFGLKLSSNL
ncbi:hypothetical protein X742_05635 [Mesorhizobium sp. LNHC232B00]|nr:hypothetical protein X742_05635 [Mesorhizobium sp. LNHC232B00]